MTPSFDYCFIGNDDQLNLSLAAPCPLIPRSEFKYESSCSVVLDEEGIHNQGCTPCFWKERIEPMCFPTTTENMHHCCCRTSDCNRRLMEDAILGWKTKTDIPEGYCKSAVLKMTDRGLKWTHRAPEKCRQGKSMCTVKVYFNSEAKENITGLESGCISDADWEEIRDDSISEKCQALSIEWLGIGANHSARCCTGKDCLRKFYRKEVFLKLQRMRLHEENEYMRLLDFEVSRKTEHIWAADQDYFAAQSIFGKINVLGSAV
ncbi:hypothetical protein Q1695_003454 [Nippostrongylus brasiliensis]|nr:hypothetical protein Q1695_003454 [Nippostrongylus brasiliensis]